MNKECCEEQIKFYTFLTCRLCWKCQSCKLQGCDKIMYQMNPVPIKTKFLVEQYLTAHTKPKKPKRGLDTSVVIMKIQEKTRIYMTEPVNVYPLCDVSTVKLYTHKVDSNRWACDIGPFDKPFVATLTLDNKNIPLIVTK